jgi:beta-N-acetylhexosaminidase
MAGDTRRTRRGALAVLGALIAVASLALLAPTFASTPAQPQPPSGAVADKLAGERIVYGFDGTHGPRRLLRNIHRGRLAGVVLYSFNIKSRHQLRRLTRRLQHARPKGAPPLLIMLDQEGGRVKRLEGAPYRSAAQLGGTNSKRLAFSDGRATARNLRRVGVNVNLAPVLDVARRGTIMRAQDRSYGSRPRRVRRIGGAFASGLAAGRVAATGKHFPGLGLARDNQDWEANTIHASRHTLRRVDEAPYRALRGRRRMVMIGSARYPSLDHKPAVFSRRIVTGELRRRLGFKGVAMTDSLDTQGLSDSGSSGSRAVRSAQAGVDVLFLYDDGDGRSAQHDLAEAISDGVIDRAEAEQSATRVLRLRKSL